MMYTLPKSREEMFHDPREADVVCLDQSRAEELLSKVPDLTVLYTARMDMVEEIVSQFTHDREFFYMDEEGGVPPQVLETIVWKVSREFVSKISEAVLQSLDRE